MLCIDPDFIPAKNRRFLQGHKVPSVIIQSFLIIKNEKQTKHRKRELEEFYESN